MDAPRPLPSAPVRWLLLLAGALSTVLGTIGAFLPVLPTTPFLILAAACFARSSQRFHGWLQRSPVFGPYLVQWQRDHSVPRRAKRKAYGVVVLTFTISILWVESTWMRWLLFAVGASLMLFLARLRTTHETASRSNPVPADEVHRIASETRDPG